MTEDQLLQRVRHTLFSEQANPPAELRRRVLGAAVDLRAGGASWNGNWWRLSAVAGAAIVIVGGTFVVQLGNFNDKRPAASAEAAYVLQQAAYVVEDNARLNARSHQFVFMEQRSWYAVPVASEGAPAAQSSITRSWFSVDGSRNGLVWTERPGPEGRTEVPIPGCREGRASEWRQDGTLDANRTRSCNPEPGYLHDFPVSAKDVLPFLAKRGGQKSDRETFAAVVQVLQTHYLPPASQAALFEAAARIPGVVITGKTEDALGRSGVAVGISDGGLSEQLIFDRETHEFLGWQMSTRTDGPSDLRLRPTVLIRTAVVDNAGDLP